MPSERPWLSRRRHRLVNPSDAGCGRRRDPRAAGTLARTRQDRRRRRATKLRSRFRPVRIPYLIMSTWLNRVPFFSPRSQRVAVDVPFAGSVGSSADQREGGPTAALVLSPRSRPCSVTVLLFVLYLQSAGRSGLDEEEFRRSNQVGKFCVAPVSRVEVGLLVPH